MNFWERLNNAVEYIECQLTGILDYEEAAKLAGCSVYNFQRMFSFIIDFPLSEYVRRRRLTLAALELQQSDIKIIDLAINTAMSPMIRSHGHFRKCTELRPHGHATKGLCYYLIPESPFTLW